MNINTKKQILVIASIIFSFYSLEQLYPQDSDFFYNNNNSTIGDTISDNNYFLLGVGYTTGYLISHAKEVVNLRGLNPRAYEIDFNWHLYNDEVWNDCQCYPRVGAFLAFHDFNNSELLGYGFSGGLSFTYFFGLPSDYNFHLKGKGGASYLTKPFDKDKHPDNMAYSTHINYLLSIGIGISIKLNKNFEIQLDASMNHQSNAALLEPNGGINYWAASISTNYFFYQPVFKERNILDPYLQSERIKRWGLSFSWGISSMPYPMPGQVPMYGITILRSVQFCRIACFNFGAELERNGRAIEITRRIKPETEIEPWRASLLVGVEFLMGRTILSAQVGGYIYRPFAEKDDVYQRWGLMYNIYENIFAGINFKSYRNSADHLSVRITLTF